MKFDDKPENYLAWKSSFLYVIDNLALRAGEESDLLIKWLGTESSEHARSIKSVNVKNPSVGLEHIWERLDELYVSPEATVLKELYLQSLKHFLKLGPRNTIRSGSYMICCQKLSQQNRKDTCQACHTLTLLEAFNLLCKNCHMAFKTDG